MDKNLPTHIGIIMDGNRRWARSRGLPSLEGHRRGALAFEKITEHALDRGIKYLTAYVFSTENWAREDKEVSYLMSLLSELFTRKIDKLVSKGARILFIGDLDDKRIPKTTKADILQV